MEYALLHHHYPMLVRLIDDDFKPAIHVAAQLSSEQKALKSLYKNRFMAYD